MSRGTLKNTGIGLSILTFILLFVAVERYQANAASVAAMNQMMETPSFGLNVPGIKVSFGTTATSGHISPGVPVITTYAVFFAILSIVGAVTCFVKAKAQSIP